MERHTRTTGIQRVPTGSIRNISSRMEQDEEESYNAPMEALLLDAKQATAITATVRIPICRPNEVRIRVHAIALNPVDSLYTYSPLGKTGRVVGSDFAGTVHMVSPMSSLEHGQRVAGFLQGACSRNDRPGAFAEYIVCPADLVWRVPDVMMLEEAASISLCGLTAAQAVFLRLGLEPPFSLPSCIPSPAATGSDTEDPIHFLIYGASTSIGMYAAQLIHHAARASGRRIVLVGVASQARFPLLQAKPYAYDFLLDYHNASWPSQVLQLTKGHGMDLALDCISEGSTVADVSRTLHLQGKLAVTRSLEGGAWDSSNLVRGVVPSYSAVWDGLGEFVQYQGFVLSASSASRAFTVAFYDWLSGGAKLDPNPIRLMPGGLAKVVPDGFALLGSGLMEDRPNERKEAWMQPISGEKMVYRLGD
jgi:NADPH:quinone reductase-like Zn-dependent oxidoreductase